MKKTRSKLPKYPCPLNKKKTARPKNRNYVQDSYTEQALQKGYKARSVFKLREIDRKYKLLRPGIRVLELGAAPGSWSSYILQQMQLAGAKSNGSWLCAVDLQALDAELQRSPLIKFFQVDFSSPELRNLLLPYMESKGLFDVILSDMAPKTSGNRTVDTERSKALSEEIMAALPFFLKTGGTLLFKLFQGGGEHYLPRELRQLFAFCHGLRPQAVRRQSFEVYFLCRDYRPENSSNHGMGVK